MKVFFYSVLFIMTLNFSTNACLMYYTFEGEVSYAPIGSDIEHGDLVRSVFAVDFEAQGFWDYYDTSRSDSIYSDYETERNGDIHIYSYFYSDLVSELLFTDLCTENAYKYKVGAAVDIWDNSSFRQSYLLGGNQNNYMLVISLDAAADTWVVGTKVKGVEQACTQNGKLSVISELTLISISDSYEVPEPQLLTTFATGLLVLFGTIFFNRRLKRIF